MAPKVQRKISVSGRDPAVMSTPKAFQGHTSMPPPPDPVPPKAILEPEVSALGTCLRSAVVKTGQIYGFYADAKKLGIQQYAPRPPRSLTTALGREVEKYDQLCDAIESQLQHAMTILQRDIHREEQRLKAEADAAAAAAKAAADAEAAAAAATSSPMVSPTSPAMSNPFTGLPVESSPDGTNTKSLPTPTRRQSTVSLSSLQRPNFQHKLDLSAASMRINPDEFLTIPSGLSSPVTLAPKSSHRAIPQDLVMALSEANRPVDIDLTVADADMEMQQAAGAAAAASLDPTVGTSADKPIELDLDMDGLFSAAADSGGSESHQQLFGQPSTHPLGGEVSNITPNVKPKQEEDFFSDALNTGTASGNMGDILTSLSGVVPTGSGQPTNMGDVTHSSLSTSGPMKAPSPGTILAGFDAVQHPPQDISGQSNDAHFDINSMDLGGFGAGMFDANPQDGGMSVSEMEDMFNLDGTGGQNTTAAP